MTALSVLVVEDDPDLSLALVWLLRSAAVDATPLSAGDVLSTDDHQWDGAVVDLMMPYYDGVDVAKHLDALGIPVVILTASGAPSHHERVREAGFELLQKPSSAETILDRLGLSNG